MRTRLASVFAVLLLLASSCSASTQIPLGDGAVPSTAGATDDSGPSPAIDTGELSSEAIYRSIEQSIVFVAAPDDLSSGSGFVIDGGWIVTNAHVVDRHEQVRIGRSDGTELGLVPVHAVDWVFDLALVGPIDDARLLPVTAGASSDLVLGSRVLLAGFPDEDSAAPTPTLTEGIVSRLRTVALGNYPFVQVDATIAPGQSGGAMVNGQGELVGISGLEFGQGEFGLVFASDAMWSRIDDMIVAAEPELLSSGPPVFELDAQVGPLRNFGFTLEVEASGSLDLLVNSAADVWVDVQTLGGITVGELVDSSDPFRVQPESDEQLYVDELAEGGEEVIATIDPGIYQVVIGAFSDTVVDVEVLSVNPLRTFSDVEEGRILPANEIVEGDFDWQRDTDQWQLPLTAGEQVTITADGIADTLVVVRFNETVIASSDDEGLGLFGTGSRLTFTAAETGTYVVEVGTFDQTRWGYLIEAAVS